MNDNNEKNFGDKVGESFENFINTTDHDKEYDAEDKKKNKLEAIASYIPFVPLYFIITLKYKNSSYFKFHVNQGLLVTFCWVFSIFASLILSAIFKRESMIINDIPLWISLISYLLYCCSFLLTIFGIINTANESSKELPLIGKIKIIK